ncbi:MAG: DUF4412 domain-containing protein [Deltaproteobacteria bacterium]|nr:DUF4412 domain-containing protein [Deltaproteobacteria bacterium]
MRRFFSLKRRMVPVIAMVLSVGSVGISSAADFSADFMATSPGGNEAKGKIYMQGNKTRMEPETADGKAVTISRPDKKVVWILMGEEKMYMEQAYQEDPRTQEWTPAREARATFVGNETVSGLPCKKYKAADREQYYWISDQIAFPVKMQDPDGTMLLKNIKIGKLPGSLFEIPAGYQKFAMPGMGPGMPRMPGGRP